MRFAVVVCIAAAASVAAATPFQDFIARYGKVYSLAEYPQREATFNANLALINEYNSQCDATGCSARMGITKFADMTPEEFKESLLVHCNAPAELPASRYLPPVNTNEGIPESWDWVARGAVTPVKDQGSVGSCWAFSTTGNIEGQMFLATKKLTSLSEEYLVDCDDLDCSVFGGWPYLAYQYIEKSGGIPSEEAYPYCSGTGECYPCMLNKNTTFCGPPPEYCNMAQNDKCPHATPVASLKSWAAISKNETEIAMQLVSRGPLSVAMDASWLQVYTSGVWNPPDGAFGCDSTGQTLNHAVLIVGYGVANETIPYWKVKNSWNADWGEEGYFRIIRGVGKCGINTQVTTSIVSA